MSFHLESLSLFANSYHLTLVHKVKEDVLEGLIQTLRYLPGPYPDSKTQPNLWKVTHNYLLEKSSHNQKAFNEGNFLF